ncbi:uncharacterized protein LOC118647144 [Monomorium pharaonis]|uniref:uncharacterized protein LOC118647144 n=1 Tax=Monomorium pharaonis TaxID=307658 RepID=UPI001745CAD0|nr:uncharacterized protein LOC118647144 [Monomorium pharaonis]
MSAPSASSPITARSLPRDPSDGSSRISGLSTELPRLRRRPPPRLGPALQFALNTATHAATGYSPAFLVHGRELARPHPEVRRQPEELRPEDRHRALRDAYEVARVHLARAYQAQEHHYNLRRREWRPKVGEKVWKRDRPLSNRENAFNAKLAPKFRGPMEVRRIHSPVVVDLRDAHGKWHRHIHVQNLKPDQREDTGETEGETDTDGEEDADSDKEETPADE